MRRALVSWVASLLAVGGAAYLGFGLARGEPRDRPYIIGIGASLLSQQAPQQVPQQAPQIDRGVFDDPRGRYMEERERLATAGKFPFYWTRARYSSWGRRGFGYGTWAVDFPKSDQQFLVVIKRLIHLNAYDWENDVDLDNPMLRRFPLIYMLEVGGMYLSDEEVAALRGYMDAGGFVIVDDFWGQEEWDVFEFNFRRVYPDKQIVDITLDHPLYSAYYTIDHVEMTPAIGNTIRRTECYGCVTQVKGVYDDEGRLMMVINFNTDLGDAWEWAEDPSYPLETSTYAFEMGANLIVYAMSH